jgi:hypothetical protein
MPHSPIQIGRISRLVGMPGASACSVRVISDRPDRDRLALRFERFKAVA